MKSKPLMLSGIRTPRVVSYLRKCPTARNLEKPIWSCWQWALSEPEDLIADELKLHRDNRSNINAIYEIFETNIDKVYAAGDARRGQSLVVWAIQEGKLVAREIDRSLMGHTHLK